ncbi:T9SS type A sorting domain-containing protein [Chryseobacterium sp. Tr-659]|uniref:T9SS type A sorting domain-containing protein n=1 Tax=Chryseobacterium sp. Tr-659 TaxID=2608340 RepID=UPI00142373A1|nr:T9SS type A sorting domain-containing protein [Chryseobacterium sp. Tr-659]NIF07257.1 T9SS type A sorting domain-containing protein [Chryseobacterium sp. Tr-659]
MKCKIILILGLLVSANWQAQIKVLFDATKAESAGNADWVVDADVHNLKFSATGVTTNGTESNPQRFPTPAQSGITAATPETYWQGALSNWGIDLVKQGYTIETLPYNASITYGNSSNPQDLSNYKVFVVVEPNIRFSDSEKIAMLNFVQNGGGLFMISDHNQSDRNNDGWDSPAIWNDFFTTNGVIPNPFGISFDLNSVSPITTNFVPINVNPTILSGPQGTPTQMKFSSGATMTLDKNSNASVQGLVFTSSASTAGSTNVMFATSTYGNGRICALGDSSVPDDGTGDPNDTLYNGYTGDANGNHRPLLVNAIIWLAGSSSLSTQEVVNKENAEVYPNPSADYIYIKNNKYKTYKVIDEAGRIMASGILQGNSFSIQSIPSGIYYLILQSDKETQSTKIVRK